MTLTGCRVTNRTTTWRESLKYAMRETLKLGLGPMLRWSQESQDELAFSVILGVPWDLRQILPVNLRFIARTDVSDLRRIHIVFDRRPRPGAKELIERVKREFPQLPLSFQFYPALTGAIIERIHVSTFYNSMNTVLALRECQTRYAVLHDFDLYPLRADHFTSIVQTMRERNWRFSGHELTHFDGLTDEDNQIGTWTLGIDVEWLRANWRPIDCFHRVERVRGRLTNLDPYAAIQFRTPERGLTGIVRPDEFCHVKNLCSTYLRLLKGVPLNAKVAWRLHYLWYLEELSGHAGRLEEVTRAMAAAESGRLNVDGREADYSQVHVTAANVLRTELSQMERFLMGAVRPEVAAYLDGFESFLWRVGKSERIVRDDGSVVWEARATGAAPAMQG